jgi:hypothetical protein
MPTDKVIFKFICILSCALFVYLAVNAGSDTGENSGSTAGRVLEVTSDTGGSVVIYADKSLWRDPNLGDYPRARWAAWVKQTGSNTPWRSEGDFDSDGLNNVAKVMVRLSDGSWMTGVEFGGTDIIPSHDSDDKPLMAFNAGLIDTDVDSAGAQPVMDELSMKAQAGDAVTVEQRRSIISQLAQAMRNTSKRAHRVTLTLTHTFELDVSPTQNKITSTTVTAFDYLPPQRLRITQKMGDVVVMTSTQIGDKFWLVDDGAPIREVKHLWKADSGYEIGDGIKRWATSRGDDEYTNWRQVLACG